MIVAGAKTSPFAPFAAWARLLGMGARAHVPTVLRRPAYRAFGRVVGANLDEAELDLEQYDSLGELFARRLRPGARPMESDAAAVIAPCDGVVAAAGEATGGKLIQAKGLSYRLEDLVVDRQWAQALVNGPYATIYLSPRDYHRVHAPLDGRLVAYDYVPGALWPVSPRFSALRPELLARNERVVIWLETPSVGRVAIVMVGAAGVGNIQLAHSSEAWERASDHRRVQLDERIERGDELGVFRLGSTVVMVFPPRAVALTAQAGEVMRFGQRIGTRGAP